MNQRRHVKNNPAVADMEPRKLKPKNETRPWKYIHDYIEDFHLCICKFLRML